MPSSGPKIRGLRTKLIALAPGPTGHGGLRGPKVNPQEVDGRVAQLRAQAKEEQASKTEPGSTAQGKAKAHPNAKAKEKAGWAVPEDYQGPVTALEQELGNLAEGPDFDWHHRFLQGTETTGVQAQKRGG